MDIRNKPAHQLRGLEMIGRIVVPDGWAPGQEFPQVTEVLKANGW
jgi:hypothetical protein